MYHDPSPTTTAPIDEDVLAEVAERRVRGQSWEQAAEAVGWDAADLRRVMRNNPAYKAAYKAAEDERDQEADAEGMHRLRQLLRDEKPDIARRAAEIIMKYLTAKRRDETRLEIERMRAAARAAREAARRAKADEEGADEDDPLTPEQQKQWDEAGRRAQERAAETASREKRIVYLWGGCHKIGDTPPDETDVPLVMVSDMTMPGRHTYRALTDPPPADPLEGRFLPKLGKGSG
jgi:hypothetical protein